MKVAVVSAAALPSPAPSYGGLESIAAYVAEALAEDHETTLYAAKGSRTTKASLFETVEPQFEPDVGHPVELAAWETMREQLVHADVVVDMSHAFHAYRLKLEHPEVRVLKVVHDYYPWERAPPPGSYDILAGVSRFHGQFLQDRWGVPVRYLYNGIPTDQLSFSAMKKDELVFLSRVAQGKGALEFLDLVQIAGVPAILAGDDDPQHGADPAYRRAVIQKARGLGVDYRGTVSDEEKKDLLAHASAIVVPLAEPYREIFGIWIVEALASGTPVFTCDLGAPREIVTPTTGGVGRTLPELTRRVLDFTEGKRKYDPGACRERARHFDIATTGEAYRKTVALMGPKF